MQSRLIPFERAKIRSAIIAIAAILGSTAIETPKECKGPSPSRQIYWSESVVEYCTS